MKMNEIRTKAKALGLNSFGKKKIDLIKSIQTREGYTACFKTKSDSCEQQECCWRADCLTN